MSQTRKISFAVVLVLLNLVILVPWFLHPQAYVIGSKKFAESNVLGEIALRKLAATGLKFEHHEDIGSTGILWSALKSGNISAYPEYTGTIDEEILKVKAPLSAERRRSLLAKYDVGITGNLGFNDTYALVMRKALADQLNIHTISDLRSHPNLRISLTHEFLNRADGWKPLAARYGLNFTDVNGIDHTLGYQALAAGQIDLTDAYSTDAEIAEYNLVALTDDLHYFPEYNAVFVYSRKLPSSAVAALESLEGTISADAMIKMNALARKTTKYAQAADLYFTAGKAGVQASKVSAYAADMEMVRTIGSYTFRHLQLVLASLELAILIGIPLGILASRSGPLGSGILATVGIVQTIPALALLALLVPIPHFGTTEKTAVAALFLYSLLPIVRNTATGIQDIPASLRESAEALGLEPRAQLRLVLLPMASRTILAGIKTSAVINIGAATLAALIGAGGLGELIIRGLSLNDNTTVLEGAIPAALLAILVQFLFDRLDHELISPGLHLKTSR